MLFNKVAGSRTQAKPEAKAETEEVKDLSSKKDTAI